MNLRKMPMYAGLAKTSAIDTLAVLAEISCVDLVTSSVSCASRRAW